MTSNDPRLFRLAAGQSGIFRRDQAAEAGVNRRRLRRRVAGGELEQIGAHTFRSSAQPSTPLLELRALILDIGEPCWVCGPTAAAVHGFDGFRLVRPYDVMILRGRNIVRVGARIHTTSELPLIDRCTVFGLPVLSPARTVIDLPRYVDAELLTMAYDSGLRDGGFNDDLVHRRIVALRTKGRHGIPKLLDVIAGCEVIRGGHSWLEREFLRITAAAGLPRPATQQVLSRAGDKVVRVDCRYPGTNVVVELLGYRFHRSESQLRRDAERANALLLDGFAPYQFTYSQLAGTEADARFVVATVVAALAGSASPPRPSDGL